MKIRIEIEGEGTHWYADSPDIEGFVALGDSLEEVRKLFLTPGLVAGIVDFP